jgi:hypothetical protein
MTASKQILDSLHDAVAQDLLNKVQSGEASAAELTAAIKFLKDNGIEALPASGTPLGNLVDSLPFNVEPIRKHG